MLRWFLSLFRPAPKDRPPAQDRAGTTSPRNRKVGEEPDRSASTGGKPLSAEAREFYLAVVTPSERADLQSLPADDRVFLSGVLKRIRENQLEIPVLPRAALEISKLLSNPDSNVADYVRVLNQDPALSVDVLRIANSAYYGFSAQSRSIREALMRIGTGQVRGLLVVSHLKGKVLQGGVFQQEAGWLSDLSTALALLGKDLAPSLGLAADEAFTRGLLMHVEHFVILGTVADVSKEHQRRIRPSSQSLREAFWRFGPKVRELAARAWQLDSLLTAQPGPDLVLERYVQLRRALVASWSGEEAPPEVEGLPKETLAGALTAVGAA